MVLNTHAQKRMQSRAITKEDIQTTLEYGRTFYAREAVFKVIGRKEIERYRDELDLQHLDGVHVVTAHSGTVITAYRNRHFHRTDFRKPRYRPQRKSRATRLWLRRQTASDALAT